MDQQSPNQTPPRPVPTEAEIARLEAEAAAALQRGEPLPHREGQPQAEPQPAPAAPDFVPYVDDVPEPPRPRPAEVRADQPAPEDDDEDDEEYIPSEWEKRIDALTPRQWKLWQIAGGAAVGLVCVGSLFVLGQELSAYSLILAAVLAILLPRYLERAWRRKLNTARYAMIVAILIGLVIMALIAGVHTGFTFTEPK